MWDKMKKKNKILEVYQCSPEWWDTFINLSYLNIFFVLSRMEIDSKMKNNAAPQIYDLSIKAKGLNVLYEETAFFLIQRPYRASEGLLELFKFLLLLLE